MTWHALQLGFLATRSGRICDMMAWHRPRSRSSGRSTADSTQQVTAVMLCWLSEVRETQTVCNAKRASQHASAVRTTHAWHGAPRRQCDRPKPKLGRRIRICRANIETVSYLPQLPAQQSYQVAHIRGLGLNMGARRLQCAIALSRRRSPHDQLSADGPGRPHAVGITYANTLAAR